MATHLKAGHSSKNEVPSTQENEDEESFASSSPSPSNTLDFQKSVNKRLEAMTDRQDSIQALSLWMIHHKIDCQKIAACWLAAMKKAKISRRLPLFYLANDVVQSCKKKNAKIYLLAFKNVLKDAVVLVRDASIKHKIERIFHIWEERHTYFTDFIQELRELLNDREKVTAHVSASNFKPQVVIESIRKVKMLEAHVAMKQKQVANLKLDASKIEAVKQLKDRSHSHEFAKQFDDSYTKMQGYVKLLENEVEQRTKLIEILENGQTFYEVQNDDAMVVANAYRNFGIRINNLKKRLIDYKETLADESDSPIPSPSAEAPSPGCTPPQLSGDEASDAMDMELSDAEEDTSGTIIAAEPYTPSSSSSLTDRLAAMGNSLPGPAADPRQSKAASSNSYSPAEQLQREKAGSTTENTDHTFLFSMVAAKAQATGGRQDKSVLKSLTEFAEKVKNPPPKDWSEFNRKRIEQELAQRKEALQKAQKSVSEQQNLPTLQSETIIQPKDEESIEKYVPEATSSQLISSSYQPSSFQSSDCYQTSPVQSTESYKPNSAQLTESYPKNTDQLSVSYESSTIKPEGAGHESNFAQSDSASFQTSSVQSLVSSYKQGSSQVVVAQPPLVDRSHELQSMSWPPSASPTISPTPTSLHSSGSDTIPSAHRPSQRMPYASQPNNVKSSHITVVTTTQSSLSYVPVAEHVSIKASAMTGAVVTVSSAPPPPPVGRTISSKEQQDALDLLDSIHAKTSTDLAEQPGASAHAEESLGNPIQTLGNKNISPVVNRSYPALTRPPAPPGYYNNYRPPPAKRPYQPYGGNHNYHYY